MKEENKNSNEQTTQKPNGQGINSRNDLSIMIIMAVIGILTWITIFSLGLLINSEPYRKSIIQHFDWCNFLMSIITFTPTNIAIICIISAFSGGCASRLVIGGIGIAKKSELVNQNADKADIDSHLYMTENPFSSMARGLVVYFAYLAGVFITNSNAFDATTPQMYGQAAGIVSLFAFVVGYDPTVFQSFISLAGKIKQK